MVFVCCDLGRDVEMADSREAPRRQRCGEEEEGVYMQGMAMSQTTDDRRQTRGDEG